VSTLYGREGGRGACSSTGTTTNDSASSRRSSARRSAGACGRAGRAGGARGLFGAHGPGAGPPIPGAWGWGGGRACARIAAQRAAS